ncbi:hypothetical protein AHF37_08526 [Paragonimus kellicotti]|nr:hypothetical protein AHF37_08526 [Paragonimus kellicotti]
MRLPQVDDETPSHPVSDAITQIVNTTRTWARLENLRPGHRYSATVRAVGTKPHHTSQGSDTDLLYSEWSLAEMFETRKRTSGQGGGEIPLGRAYYDALSIPKELVSLDLPTSSIQSKLDSGLASEDAKLADTMSFSWILIGFVTGLSLLLIAILLGIIVWRRREKRYAPVLGYKPGYHSEAAYDLNERQTKEDGHTGRRHKRLSHSRPANQDVALLVSNGEALVTSDMPCQPSTSTTGGRLPADPLTNSVTLSMGVYSTNAPTAVTTAHSIRLRTQPSLNINSNTWNRDSDSLQFVTVSQQRHDDAILEQLADCVTEELQRNQTPTRTASVSSNSCAGSFGTPTRFVVNPTYQTHAPTARFPSEQIGTQSYASATLGAPPVGPRLLLAQPPVGAPPTTNGFLGQPMMMHFYHPTASIQSAQGMQFPGTISGSVPMDRRPMIPAQFFYPYNVQQSTGYPGGGMICSMDSEPEDAPTDIQLIGISLTNGSVGLQISWQPPTRPHGQLVGYLLHYTTNRTLPLSKWSRRRSPAYSVNTVLVGLLRGSIYFIQLRARNRHGNGPLSPIRLYRTPDASGQGGGEIPLGRAYYDALSIPKELVSLDLPTSSIQSKLDSGLASEDAKLADTMSFSWILIGFVTGLSLLLIAILLGIIVWRRREKRYAPVLGYKPGYHSEAAYDLNERQTKEDGHTGRRHKRLSHSRPANQDVALLVSNGEALVTSDMPCQPSTSTTGGRLPADPLTNSVTLSMGVYSTNAPTAVTTAHSIRLRTQPSLTQNVVNPQFMPTTQQSSNIPRVNAADLMSFTSSDDIRPVMGSSIHTEPKLIYFIRYTGDSSDIPPPRFSKTAHLHSTTAEPEVQQYQKRQAIVVAADGDILTSPFRGPSDSLVTGSPFVTAVASGAPHSRSPKRRPVVNSKHGPRPKGSPAIHSRDGIVPSDTSDHSRSQAASNGIRPDGDGDGSDLNLNKAFSTEELTQEMANLEGLMKDLSAITREEFNC